MPKLTQPQLAALTLLKERGAADYFDLAAVGANGATMAWTVRKGLTVDTKLEDGSKRWSITNAGRRAHVSGRI